jgi:hypothetical protein
VDTEKGEGIASHNEIVCIWCVKPLDATWINEMVCLKCYHLMMNAGLKEKEIFQQKKKKSKGA